MIAKPGLKWNWIHVPLTVFRGLRLRPASTDAISREVTLDTTLRVQSLLVTLYTIFSNSLHRPLLAAQTQ